MKNWWRSRDGIVFYLPDSFFYVSFRIGYLTALVKKSSIYTNVHTEQDLTDSSSLNGMVSNSNTKIVPYSATYSQLPNRKLKFKHKISSGSSRLLVLFFLCHQRNYFCLHILDSWSVLEENKINYFIYFSSTCIEYLWRN